MEPSKENEGLRELVASVATAYFSTSQVSPYDVRRVISDIAEALSEVRSFAPAPTPEPKSEEREIGVVLTEAPSEEPTGRSRRQIAASITPQALISFEDGRPYKSLRRHLHKRGLSEADYRSKWGLPDDYPMVAAEYSQARSALAKRIGLGARGAEARRDTQEASRSATSRSRSKSRPGGNAGRNGERRPRPAGK